MNDELDEMDSLTTVTFKHAGMTFEAEGFLDPGDPGGFDEPPEPPEFVIYYLRVLHLDKFIDASWLIDSYWNDDIVWKATQAAEK